MFVMYSLMRRGDVDFPHEHDGYDPFYIWQGVPYVGKGFMYIVGVRGLFGRIFPGIICHELSLVVLLHMRPSRARRLDNKRESSVSPC